MGYGKWSGARIYWLLSQYLEQQKVLAAQARAKKEAQTRASQQQRKQAQQRASNRKTKSA